MSQNTTQPNDGNVNTFLDQIVDDAKRADSRRLRDLMESASGEPATMWGTSIIGFGSLHYRYESGREGDTPAIGFSPRASSISLYITGGFERNGEILERLGRYRTGKGCLYLKRLTDIDEEALVDLMHSSLDRAAELNLTA